MTKSRVATLISGLALVGAVAMKLYASVSISSTDIPHAIPDGGQVTSTLNWTIGSGTGPVATDVNLQVNITHTWNGDVGVQLQGPGTVNTTIWGNCGGSADNFAVIIDDQAGSAMPCAGNVSPSGTFQSPNGATVMSAFNVNPFGTWTLTALDDSTLCTGTLNSWSLTINGPAPLPVELMRVETN